MEVRLITTGDGSDTLFVPELNEHYHSTFGAINESRHIFIEAGLKQIIDKQRVIRILEVGFGTGLNTFLTLMETGRSDTTIHYTTIEAFPLAAVIIQKLNYGSLFPGESDLFYKIHDAPWDQEVWLTKSFSLLKMKARLENFEFQDKPFHLIYFDAFGPQCQPELWTEEIFKKIFIASHVGAILVTYSAKGEVRRALRKAGFSTERIEGPTGKREITRATKSFQLTNSPVHHFTR